MTIIVDLGDGDFGLVRLYTASGEVGRHRVTARTIAGTISYDGG
jgi:hypothetical protein